MHAHASPPRRPRVRPALAAILACAALGSAPGLARAADPGLTLTALSPASWWQPDGTFRVPLRLQLGSLITIDRLEIEIDGLPGILTVPVPAQPVDLLEGLNVTLPGVAATRTIRVNAWVVGDPPLYGVGPTTEKVAAQTVVSLAPPNSGLNLNTNGTFGNGGQPGAGGGKAGTRPKITLLRIQVVKGRRFALVRSSAKVTVELTANRRVGKRWKAAKRVRTTLLAQKVRRVPLAALAPGRYQLKAIVTNAGGLTATRTVAVAVRPAVRKR